MKLLRFLQEQRLQRVGGRQEIQVDTRLVAATNADLKELIDNGKFREDLYFRLAVVTIRLLPLRERGEDIVFLAREFLQTYASSKRSDQDGFRAGRVARNEPLFVAWKCPRTPKPRENVASLWLSGSRVTAKDLELDQDRGRGIHLQQLSNKRASTSNAK